MSKNKELQNQVYLYSLETKDFYTDEENEISEKYFKSLRIKKRIKDKKKKCFENKKKLNKLEEERALTENEKDKYISLLSKIDLYNKKIDKINKIIKNLKDELNKKLSSHDGVRTLREDALRKNKVVGLFESSLTRICGMKTDEITTDLFIIRIYHYQILKSIIENGFLYNGNKYQYFTSSAGQIRTRKIVCINSELYKKHENTIACGLTLDIINSKGGVNINKYQAYLALSNSASMKWNRFNIDRVVVVDDFSTIVNTLVDFIDRDTYEIERKKMNMEIEHMDGCGIMLPTVSKKAFMFRMPWVKGLLVPFDFKKFILENSKSGASTKIKDIYGKEYDIIKDNINIILTKSQFKMWKYYNDWEEYKNNFKKYNCEACKLNVEDIGEDATLNYQMLQTLVSMTENELKDIAKNTIDDILKLGTDKDIMLRVLGATKENNKKNYFQKSLLLYPELLNDPYCREVIKNKKRKMVKEAKAGKLRINGKYTYIIPDLYAFCEWLFMGKEKPEGLLQNGEVYCSLFKEGEVDVLRSPHLYKEHAIRKNVKKEEYEKWFITKGIYTSIHDLISRILQFDVDGDKALVIQDNTLINVAKREMEDIVPLFYVMEKAKDEIVTSEKIYDSLTSAYKANIGIISNDITKIWNSENPNIDAVKWLTMYNNFVIDYAKTLFLPKPPKEKDKIIKSFTKNKVPYFFIYAKDKEEKEVEKWNNSTVNKLNDIIPDKPIQFKYSAGELKYEDLMYNPKTELDDEIISKFKEFESNKNLSIKDIYDINTNEIPLIYLEFRKYVEENYDLNYFVDVLIKYLFKKKNNISKVTLWSSFGDVVYNNLLKNVGDTIQCKVCNKRVEKTSKSKAYCEKCWIKIREKQNKEKSLRYYYKNKKFLPN